MVATSFITALALMGAAVAAPVSEGSYSPKPGDLPAALKVVDTDLCLDNAHGNTNIGNPINGWYCDGASKKKQGFFRENGKLRLSGVEDRCIGVNKQNGLVLASCTKNGPEITTVTFGFGLPNEQASTPGEGAYLCTGVAAVPGRITSATCVKAPMAGVQVRLVTGPPGTHTPISWEDPAAGVYRDSSAPHYPVNPNIEKKE